MKVLATEDELLRSALRMRTATDVNVVLSAPVVKDCACIVLPAAEAQAPSVVMLYSETVAA